jgi:hypothetical protein
MNVKVEFLDKIDISVTREEDRIELESRGKFSKHYQ